MALVATFRPPRHKGVNYVRAIVVSSFHTSFPMHGSRPKMKQAFTIETIDPVLGYRNSKKALWSKCDLEKIMVTQQKIHDPRVKVPELNTHRPLTLPKNFQWGISENNDLQNLLFEKLPSISAQTGISSTDAIDPSRPSVAAHKLYEGQWRELRTAHLFSRLVDLSNANGPGIAFENRRRCVWAFSSQNRPNDTGRPEVQAALLTVKIRRLQTHLLRNRRDISNRLPLQKLVHARAKILKYLKRLDRARFEAVLARLGMEEGAIEGELTIKR